ncbi:MAG: hypothetical protein AAGB93_12420 [Planctomycetota bacterium]
MLLRLLRCKKGAALLEYSLLAAGVALISAAGVSIFGHKTNDMISSVAAIMPGAHADDNGPIISGKVIETTGADTGSISVNVPAIVGQTDAERLGNNLGVADLDTLVLEVELPGAP